MKKLTANTIVAAIGMVWGTAAVAGSITSPANDAAATKYAVEAVVNTTDVTVPAITYTMGVARTTAQDFTVVIKPSSGAAFTAGSCAAAVPVVAGAGAGTANVKRASTTECAYEVDVTTATTTATTLTFTGFVLDSHTLGTSGNSASVTLDIYDLGETARIDNTGTLSRVVATSVTAVNIYANTSDTATTADVNATGGPLTGFVAGGDDTATIAKASIRMDNNSANAKGADGATNFDFTATTGTATVTATGEFGGLKANKYCLDLDNDGTLCEAGEVLTVANGVGTLSAIASANFPAQGATHDRVVSFEADGTTNLGTSRTFVLGGTITPQVGAAHALVDTNSKNSTWWVWTANASELQTPYFSTDSNYLSRFFFQSYNGAAVGYTATCYAESGVTITYGNSKTGNLNSGTTAVNAADICTFSDPVTRGSIRFIINSPIEKIKGTYQAVNKTSFAITLNNLTRPYKTSGNGGLAE